MELKIPREGGRGITCYEPPTFPLERVAIPTKIPNGTVNENNKHRIGLRSARKGTFVDEFGKTEMRTPRDRPSKS